MKIAMSVRARTSMSTSGSALQSFNIFYCRSSFGSEAPSRFLLHRLLILMCSGSLRKPNLLHRSNWHDKAIDRILHRTPDSIWPTN